MSKNSIKPLANLVLATPDMADSKTSSGLYIPETAQEKPKTATIVEVGPLVKGLSKGQKIIYKSFSATDIKHAGQDYLLVAIEDVLAIVD